MNSISSRAAQVQMVRVLFFPINLLHIAGADARYNTLISWRKERGQFALKASQFFPGPNNLLKFLENGEKLSYHALKNLITIIGQILHGLDEQFNFGENASRIRYPKFGRPLRIWNEFLTIVNPWPHVFI